jgi:hypothetical protein
MSIIGADIEGEVDLQWARIPFPSKAIKCVFSHAILLSRSQVACLDLGGCSVKQLKANGTQFGGNVFLRSGFKAEGPVDLFGATIGGNLDRQGGQFVGDGKAPALTAPKFSAAFL